MAETDDPFLSRWSRRKRATQKEAPGQAAPETDSPAPARAAAAPAVDPEAGDPEVVARLPDLESLDESSDFSPFLQQGVPEALRRAALRKLWRLNPVFANLDGLNDYDEDFRLAGSLVANLKTLYRAGKGYLDPEAEAPAGGERPAEPAAGAQQAEATAAPTEAAAAPTEDAPAGGAATDPRPQAAPESEPAGDAEPEAAASAPRRDEKKAAKHKAGRRSARDRRWGGFTG